MTLIESVQAIISENSPELPTAGIRLQVSTLAHESGITRMIIDHSTSNP